VLFAWFKGHVVAYIATPATKGPLYFLWQEEKGDQLFGLCFDALAANVPELARGLRRFLMSLNKQRNQED